MNREVLNLTKTPTSEVRELKNRLRLAVRALEFINERTEHKPACPLFDQRNVRLPLCECWKRRLAGILGQARRQRWKKR